MGGAACSVAPRGAQGPVSYRTMTATEPPVAPRNGSAGRFLVPLRDAVRIVAVAAEKGLGSAESARAAFYLSLSTVPALMVVFSFAGLVGSQEALEGFVHSVADELPPQARTVVTALIQEIKTASSAGFLSFSALLSLWGASNVIDSLAHGINRAYRARRPRPWWRKKALALLLLVGNSAFLIVGAVLVLAGPRLAVALGLEALAGSLRWPLVWIGMGIELGILYYVLPVPKHPRSLRAIALGSAAGTVLWVVGTLLFRYYLERATGLTLVYGVLGGILVWMLWLYLSAASVFVGADIAAALERRAERRVGRRAGYRQGSKTGPGTGPRADLESG